MASDLDGTKTSGLPDIWRILSVDIDYNRLMEPQAWGLYECHLLWDNSTGRLVCPYPVNRIPAGSWWPTGRSRKLDHKSSSYVITDQ